MTLKKSNYYVVYWCKLIESYIKFGYIGDKVIINNNMYILLLLLFKNFTLKDICFINYNILLDIYNYHLYHNIQEFRLYFIFYYIMIKNDSIKFTFFIDIQIRKQELYKMQYKYYHNNFINMYFYLLLNKEKFLLSFSKYKFFNNKFILTKIFLYNEFILKVDYTTFNIYKKYIEYFRGVKYNEYIANNKLLWIILN